MKKTVAFIVLLLVVFCGCARTSAGNADELTRYSWSAALKGGGEARLEFGDDTARLEMNCGGEKEVIEGGYLADETSFVIFDADAGQNYRFEYVPRGKKLDLSYDGHTIEMEVVATTGQSALLNAIKNLPSPHASDRAARLRQRDAAPGPRSAEPTISSRFLTA